MKFRTLFIAIVFLAGCSKEQCVVAPPQNIVTNTEAAQKISAELTAFVKAPIKSNLENEFKGKAESTFQAIPEKYVACYILVQAVVCLAEKPEAKSVVDSLFAYIRESDKCGSKPVITPTSHIKSGMDTTTPIDYKAKLAVNNVILSVGEQSAAVEGWLKDKNSGYQQFADVLLDLLKGRAPIENSTVLVEIVGYYKDFIGKERNTFVPPPYDANIVKKAFLEDWKNRNSGPAKSIEQAILGNTDKLFEHIVAGKTN